MNRIRLLRAWKNPYKKKPHPVGSVLQVTLNLGSELIAEGIAEVYNGEYPPKGKIKFELGTLNKK
jgi:hypothetical protein